MSKIKRSDYLRPVLGLAIQGRVNESISLLKKLKRKKLEDYERSFLNNYLKRFEERTGRSYRTGDLFIKSIINFYQEYWFMVLLEEKSVNSSKIFLFKSVSSFCRENGYSFKEKFNEDYYCMRLKKIIEKRGFNCITGVVSPFYELEVWSSQKVKKYKIELPSGFETVNTHLLSRFICKGWLEFATMGVYFPGGWAQRNGLYCNVSSYNFNSESFKVSYLSHEAQHFSDLKRFPKLEQIDLEYRAKLVELSKAKYTVKKLIKSFGGMSSYNKKSPHAFANYCVVRDLSQAILDKDFSDDERDWSGVKASFINKKAKDLLIKNTAMLRKKGAQKVKRYIK